MTPLILLFCRISLTLSCPMDLKLYPLDKQTCSLKMASCKYPDSGRGERHRRSVLPGRDSRKARDRQRRVGIYLSAAFTGACLSAPGALRLVTCTLGEPVPGTVPPGGRGSAGKVAQFRGRCSARGYGRTAPTGSKLLAPRPLTGRPTLADAWKTDDLVFVWKEGDPVQIDDGLHLPRFTLEKFQTAYCNSKTNTGEPAGWQ